MAATGPETWQIAGRPYRIQASYYLALPEGLQYTIDYELPPSTAIPHQNEEALAIAFPLMQHVYQTGLFKRTSIAKFGTGNVAPTRIGVALYKVDGINRHGYAVGLSVSEIQQRLTQTQNKSEAGKFLDRPPNPRPLHTDGRLRRPPVRGNPVSQTSAVGKAR